MQNCIKNSENDEKYGIVYKYYMVRGETGQSIFPRYWLRAYHPEPEGWGVIVWGVISTEGKEMPCFPDINYVVFVLLHLIHL